MSEILVEIAEGVATVTLNRPEVKNAMNWDVVDQLTEMGLRLGEDDAVRSIVLVGSGGAFSSGIDLSAFTGGELTPVFAEVPRFQRAFSVFAEAPKPVIAAVESYCYGAGFQLALACDFRVVADGARLSVMETKWGLIPDLGATTRLPRIIGVSRAKDLAMTARIIDADESERLGLADRRCAAGDADKVAHELATELAGKPPLAIAGIKRLMNAAFDAPVSTGLEREAAVQRAVLASKDFKEAVGAVMEGRKPDFKGK